MNDMDYRLNKTCLYEQVADMLEQSIIDSGSPSLTTDGKNGDDPREKRLPSEQMLAKQFGVSRTVIREALKLLKERGLIDLRTGAGAYLTKPRFNAISNVVNRIILLNNVSDEEVYGMRLILETASCRLAASRADSVSMKNLRGILDDMRNRMNDIPARIQLDADFHIAIAKMSGNILLWKFVETMTVLLRDFIGKGIMLPGSNEDGLIRHAAIFDALESGNPDLAEAAIRDHLDVSRRNVQTVMKHQRPEIGAQ